MWILGIFIIASLWLMLFTLEDIKRYRSGIKKKKFMEHQLTAEYQEQQATIDWILNH